jgi:hypothetical protein
LQTFRDRRFGPETEEVPRRQPAVWLFPDGEAPLRRYRRRIVLKFNSSRRELPERFPEMVPVTT